MCEPTTLALAGLGISAVSTGVSFVGQQQAANAQQDYNDYLEEQTRLNAEAAYNDTVRQENAALVETRAAQSQELQEAGIEAAKARATARVAAGEAGVAGLSVDALINDFYRSEARYRDAVRQQGEFDTRARDERLRAADSQRQSRINSARRPDPQRPSFLGAALRIGGDALGTFGEIRRIEEGEG